MGRSLPIAVFLALAAGSGCVPPHAVPPPILIIPVADSPTASIFPNLHRDVVWLDKGRAHGSFIRDKKLYVILESGGKQFPVLLAGVVVPPELESVALRCVADAMPYALEVRAADPVTNAAGELQVSVWYHTGPTGAVLRDLATVVKDSIHDVRR